MQVMRQIAPLFATLQRAAFFIFPPENATFQTTNSVKHGAVMNMLQLNYIPDVKKRAMMDLNSCVTAIHIAQEEIMLLV